MDERLRTSSAVKKADKADFWRPWRARSGNGSKMLRARELGNGIMVFARKDASIELRPEEVIPPEIDGVQTDVLNRKPTN